MKTHNFSPVLLTDLIMKSCRSETGSRCAMQALQQCLDVNTCWVTRRRNTTEPNQEARFPASGEITAPSSVRHPTQRGPQIHKQGWGIWAEKESRGLWFNLHQCQALCDSWWGDIQWTVYHLTHMTHSLIHGACLTATLPQQGELTDTVTHSNTKSHYR